ncbi:MAG: EFR1 family ferrodoxin [Ruminiclostridium sp.]|nr:EFR1 family ferrodoxin [Ruminiclostridium sp.]
MIFYFTATGNSLYAARQLDSDCRSIAQEIHGDMQYKADSIGIVCPIYGHELPPIVKDFIAKAAFDTNYLYLVLTYGNRHGGAAELADEFAKSVGKHFDYINVLLMVDNWLPGFDMDEQRTIDKHIPEQLAAIRLDIAERKQFISAVTDNDREVHKEYLRRVSELPADTFKKLYRITDECIGCGICTKVCPMGCFSLNGQHAEWDNEKCITCMACAHACPETAIQLNIPEPNPKARYRNEHIGIMDIIESNWQKQYSKKAGFPHKTNQNGGTHYGIRNT